MFFQIRAFGTAFLATHSPLLFERKVVQTSLLSGSMSMGGYQHGKLRSPDASSQFVIDQIMTEPDTISNPISANQPIGQSGRRLPSPVQNHEHHFSSSRKAIHWPFVLSKRTVLRLLPCLLGLVSGKPSILGLPIGENPKVAMNRLVRLALIWEAQLGCGLLCVPVRPGPTVLWIRGPRHPPGKP